MKINLETAKLAKEKGYDESCSSVFVDGIPKELGGVQRKNSTYKNQITRPIQSDLQKWLRDVHDIHVNVNVRFHEKKTNGVIMYAYEISTLENYYDGIGDNLNHWLEGLGEYDPLYHTHEKYEEALEIGLQEGLAQIKQDESRS